MKPSPITRWFAEKYCEPTPAQAAAWPLIEAGRNVLIVSPTGTGKTFAAFLSVLNELSLLHESGGLQNTIYANSRRIIFRASHRSFTEPSPWSTGRLPWSTAPSAGWMMCSTSTSANYFCTPPLAKVSAVWMGLRVNTDQRNAMKFLRKHLAIELARRAPTGGRV